MKGILLFLTFVGVAFSQHAINQMVIGGKRESIYHSPYQVQITKMKEFEKINCGGAIVSRWNVISAAHCFKDEFNYIIVRAGSDEKDAGTKFPVTHYRIHPDFDTATFNNDLIVLRLGRPLVYSDTIRPIPLARRLPKIGSMLKVSGWGAWTRKPDYPKHLRSTEIPLVPQQKCVDKYRGVTENMICAGFGHGTSDCPGDSGGPLVWNHRLLGIISFGDNNDCEIGPSGYTSIPALRHWIIEQVDWD